MPNLIKRAGVIQELIYYQVQAEIIDIMHVFQGSRDIATMLQQEIDEENPE